MLMAGSALISSADLKSLHHRSFDVFTARPMIIEELWRGRGISLANCANMHLFYAIDKYSSNHCEDPKDRVFGLLGIVLRKNESRSTTASQHRMFSSNQHSRFVK